MDIHILSSQIVLQDLNNNKKTVEPLSPLYPFPFLISHSPEATTFNCSQELVVDPPGGGGGAQHQGIGVLVLPEDSSAHRVFFLNAMDAPSHPQPFWGVG